MHKQAIKYRWAAPNEPEEIHQMKSFLTNQAIFAARHEHAKSTGRLVDHVDAGETKNPREKEHQRAEKRQTHQPISDRMNQ